MIAGEKQVGRIGWVDIMIVDAGARFCVIEDASSAVAAPYQAPV